MILPQKPPYIKCKGFLNAASPIVTKGIPAYADSVRDPRVIGTPDWEKFWNDELYKIINGIWIGGTWIPGFYYWYVNYKQMSTVDGVMMPDVIDLHLELAYYIEYCWANGKNLLCGKGRRKGISEALTTMVVDYGWRFKEGFKAGVAAGQKVYIDGFLEKWRFSNSRVPPEFSIKTLVDNDDEIIAGYALKNAYGAYEDKGTFNAIYSRTMHINPNLFKGLYLNVLVSEEIGEHHNWEEFYGASKDTLMSGDKQKGILIGLGTAGNVNKGSKDFKKVWHNPGDYNFVKFFIPGTRMYYFGGATVEQKRLPLESEVVKKLKAHERIGVEDLIIAEKIIKQNRDGWLKSGNMKAHTEDMQNNPLDETEMFRKVGVNNFDINKLNEQDAAIMALTHPKWSKYKLDWAKDEKGMITMPLRVIATALTPYDDQNECVWIIDGELPRKTHSNLYVAAIDGYDQDTAKTSKSLGAMCVMIRHNNIADAMKMAPVAVISCRPKRKEVFYDLSAKLAVFYGFNTINAGNVLGDVANALVMQHFKDLGLWHCLANRPTKFESENSEQTHEKWVRMTNFSRPRRAALMQTHIVDHVQDIWFGELIHQLGNFDEIEEGSDNDLADAYGMALMQDVSCEIRPRDEEAYEISDRYKLTEFVDDGRGGLRPKLAGGIQLNIHQDPGIADDLFGIGSIIRD